MNEQGTTTNELRELTLIGATGAVRVEHYMGREHLVVPCVMMTEGVIHAINSDAPEYVPIEFMARFAHTWNGRPLVVGHPTKDGRQISANDPQVLAKQGVGTVFASRLNGRNMGAEAWIDVARAEAIGQQKMLADVRAGKPIEISVGGYIGTDPVSGVYNGKAYSRRWAAGIGDHLALLPGGRGACSVEMGCGTGRMAEAYLITAEGFQSADDIVDLKVVDRSASNPEGINQYTMHNAGDRVVVHAPGHEHHGKRGTISSRSRAIATVSDMHGNQLGRFHVSQLKAAEDLMAARDISQQEKDDAASSDFAGKNKSFPILKPADVSAAAASIGRAGSDNYSSDELKARIIKIAKRKGAAFVAELPESWRKEMKVAAAAADAPEQVAYDVMRSLLDGVGDRWDEASGILDQLLSDEAQPASVSDAMTMVEVETARLEALRMLCYSMISDLQNVIGACYGELAPDLPATSDPRYAEAFSKIFRAAVGKEISAKNLKTIQAAHDASHQIHDQAMALGAACDKQTPAQKMMGAEQQNEKRINDSNRFYIERVREEAVREKSCA